MPPRLLALMHKRWQLSFYSSSERCLPYSALVPALLRLTICTTNSITGTSISTPPPWPARRQSESRTG